MKMTLRKWLASALAAVMLLGGTPVAAAQPGSEAPASALAAQQEAQTLQETDAAAEAGQEAEAEPEAEASAPPESAQPAEEPAPSEAASAPSAAAEPSPEPQTEPLPQQADAGSEPQSEAANLPEPGGDSAAPQEAPGAPALEDVTALAEQNGAEAAALLAQIADEADYEAALRAVLTLYYGEDGHPQLGAFLAGLEPRGAALAKRFAAAAAQRAQTPEALGFVPGVVIVGFTEGVGAMEAQLTLTEHGAAFDSEVETLAAGLVYLAKTPLEDTVEQAAERFAADARVRYAEPNEIMMPPEPTPAQPVQRRSALAPQAGTTNDPGAGSQWHHDYINTYEAWQFLEGLDATAGYTTKGAPVRVAVLDEMPQLDHPDLVNAWARDAQNRIIGRDVFDSDPDALIETSALPAKNHGTHVAGIVGASANNALGGHGVANGAGNQYVELVPVSVFNASGGSSATITKGITWAVGTGGAQVINLSVALYNSDGSTVTPNQTLINAIDAAYAQDVVVVSSAGNRTTSGSVVVIDPPATVYPADLDHVISVINITSTGERCISSNYNGSGVVEKDISAPGTTIYSSYPNSTYSNSTGTSMASPVVAGVAALMLYAKPDLTPDEVESIIKETAQKVNEGVNANQYTYDQDGYNLEVAYGCVNALAAVQWAANQVSPVSDLTWQQGELELTIGDTVPLQYTMNPVDAKEMVSVRSADRAMLRYDDASKMLTALREGSTVLTVRSRVGGKQSQCTVTVRLPAPAEVSAAPAGYDSVRVQWQAVPGAEAYKLERLTAGGSVLLGTVSRTDYLDTGLTYGEAYSYRVTPTSRYGSGHQASSAVVGVAKIGSVQAVTVSRSAADAHTLAWVSVPGATGYEVYAATEQNGQYRLVGSTAANSLRVGGHRVNTTQWYKVQSVRGTQKGELSAAAMGELPMEAPKLTAKRTARQTVKLSWQAVPYADGYELYRLNGTGGRSLVKRITQAGTLSYTDTKLALGRDHQYSLVPLYLLNGSWAEGPAAEALSPSVAFTVEGVNATQQGTDALRIRWSRNRYADGYILYRSTRAGGGYREIAELGKSKTSYTDTGLTTGRSYYYKLCPLYKQGEKTLQGPHSAYVEGVPGLPAAKGLAAKAQPSGAIKISWRKVPGADGYIVYRARSATAKGTKIATLKASARSFTDKKAPKSGDVYYRIVPYIQSGSKRLGCQGTSIGPVKR